MALANGTLQFRCVKVGGSLRGISAIAEPRKVTASVGPNASGKSTLLAVAACLLDPDAGQVLLDGQHIAAHRLRDRLASSGPCHLQPSSFVVVSPPHGDTAVMPIVDFLPILAAHL